MSKLLSLRLTVGLIVIAIGGLGAIVAMGYELGSLRRLGPGYMPLILSLLLICLGLAEAVGALVQSAETRGDPIAWRPLLAVLAAIGGFALAVETLGMIPAIFICIGVTSLAQPKFGVLPVIVIASATSLAAWGLFSLLLGMTLPLFRLGF